MAVKFIYGNKILNPKINIQDGNGPKDVKNLIGEDPIAE